MIWIGPSGLNGYEKGKFILCLILLTGFAYLTLYERRALARMQVRVGPIRWTSGLAPADCRCGEVDLQGRIHPITRV
ncbi:hypothetical protein [Candidatus Villigracilis affinis]|uniref:hypothetical protein n=1 Tax=Candidatus Villigracilis affinis TaxID=3140682 RepID=UPI002A237403|nr:NADH-quinone oxidoreductase subunit H [Anaerolineales bacterium]